MRVKVTRRQYLSHLYNKNTSVQKDKTEKAITTVHSYLKLDHRRIYVTVGRQTSSVVGHGNDQISLAYQTIYERDTDL